VSRWRAAASQIWPRVAIVLLVIALWAIVSSAGWVRIGSKNFPSPAAAWSALTSNLTGRDGLLVGAERSLLRLVVALLAAIAVGTPIGLAMGAWRPVQRSLGTLIVGLQAIPPIAWLPLAIGWLGITERAVAFVVVIGAFPAVAIATAGAVRLVPTSLVRSARALGARGRTLYVNVVLPAAFPGYVVGLQQAWAIAWRALLAAELVVIGAHGLGHLLARASEIAPGGQFDTPLILATMAVIMVVGVAVDALLAFVDRWVRRKRGLLVRA
jgi:NitT/TauT family transport system permease protein